MPVIRSAKKKLRKDIKREVVNDKFRFLLKKTLLEAKKNPSIKSVNSAAKLLDKASHKNIIHKNKAARLKSSLSKLIAKKSTIKTAPKEEVKKVSKKPLKTVKK